MAMAYVFKPEGSVAHNLNRILSQEIKAALNTLQQPDQNTGEAIHRIRKRIKKIRALFRLIRSELNQNDFQRQNSYYRMIGQQLSSLRDASVMINTLQKLRQAQPAGVSSQVFSRLHKVLTAQQDQATRQFFDDPTQIGELTKAFEQAPQRVTGLSKHHKGFGMIAPNLKTIYQRAQKALKRAVHKPSVNKLHELRKEVKTLWYHTRLLEPSWPGLLKAYGHELGQLGELLGNDHDYGVLAQLIDSDALRLPNQSTKKALLNELQQQRIGLQAQLFPLANRLLGEQAGTFVKRFERPWKLWRLEVKAKIINQRLQAVYE